MIQLVAEMVEVLRQNGLKVAVSETLDCAEAMSIVGFDDRESTRAAMKSILCKRSADAAKFDRIFDVVFSRGARLAREIDMSLARQLEAQGLLSGDDLKMLVYVLSQNDQSLAPITRAVLGGDRGAFSGLLRRASLNLNFARLDNRFQAGFFQRRMLAGMGFEGMKSNHQAIVDELKRRGLSLEGVELVSTHLAAALRAVEAAAREEVDRQIAARAGERESLHDRSLARLSPAELAAVEQSVKRLAEKLKSRLIRRERSKRRGVLNPRKTLRRNLSLGGMPMVPQFRIKRPHRPEVVILCDVSDSVRNTSRLMLLFTYTLQSLFVRVRSFIFVSELGEITRFFKARRPEDALETVKQSQVVSMASNSNYGHAFASFLRRYSGALSRRTSVFVIGDGRNNYNESNVWALDELKQKVRRVVWLCSEPQSNWGLGDSLMRTYEKHVSQVMCVESLADFERLARDLVPLR